MFIVVCGFRFVCVVFVVVSFVVVDCLFDFVFDGIVLSLLCVAELLCVCAMCGIALYVFVVLFNVFNMCCVLCVLCDWFVCVVEYVLCVVDFSDVVYVV